MLKIAAIGIAIGVALGGTAMAETPIPGLQGEVLLVGDRDGPGRKLGHYKHKNKHSLKDRDRRGHAGSDRGYSQHHGYRQSPRDGVAPGYGSTQGLDIHVYPRVYRYGY